MLRGWNLFRGVLHVVATSHVVRCFLVVLLQSDLPVGLDVSEKRVEVGFYLGSTAVS